MRHATRLLLLLVLPLSACLQLPEPREVGDTTLPFEIPTTWSVTPDAAIEAATTDNPQEPTTSRAEPWWQEFGSASLHALVAEGLTSSPTLAQALERVRAAIAQATIEGATLSPSVDLAAGFSRQVNQFFLPGAGPQTNRVFTHNLGLNLSWELDLWGRVRSGQRAAQLDANSQQIAFHGAQLSLSGQIAKSYFSVLESQQQLAIAENDLERASTLSERIADRFQQGLRSALDVARTDAERARSLAAVENRRNQLDATLRRLEILLGRYPSGRLELQGELPQLQADVPEGLPAQLIQRRPDLLQAQLNTWSRGYREHQAQQSLLPRIALTASGGTVAEDLGDILDFDFGVWSFAGNLTQPLLDGGRLNAEVDRAGANLREAQAAFFETALRAFSEVEIALNAEQRLNEVEQALLGSLRAARSSLELSQERYFDGVLDLLDVLEARRTLFSTESEYLNTRLQRLNNRIDLHLALGGGYQHPTPTESPKNTQE